jgi:hypothetical protein
MEAVDILRRRYGGGALAAAAALGILAYLGGWPAVARGLVLGGLFSALNFHLMGKALAKHLAATQGPARRVLRIARAGRILLLGVPLVLAVKLPALDLPATVAGLFMVPMVILLDAAVQHVCRAKPSPD